jgi:lambda family phage tail tape measure protein
MTAGEAFKSFGKSVIGTIAEMVAAEAKSAILKPLFSAAFSGLGNLVGGIGGETAGNASKALGGSPFNGTGAYQSFANANGGVYSSPGLSAYSGQVVDKPTIFPFAKGIGLMGEAGAEAILPLQRNSKGKLGVVAENTGQATNSPIYYINTTVNAGGSATPDTIATKASEAIVRAIVKQEIATAVRPGNQLNKFNKVG